MIKFLFHCQSLFYMQDLHLQGILMTWNSLIKKTIVSKFFLQNKTTTIAYKINLLVSINEKKDYV